MKIDLSKLNYKIGFVILSIALLVFSAYNIFVYIKNKYISIGVNLAVSNIIGQITQRGYAQIDTPQGTIILTVG